MQLQNIRFAGERLIESYGNGAFQLTDQRIEGTLRILPEEIRCLEDKDPASLAMHHLQPFLDHRDQIELVLLGTGDRQIFPEPELRATFLRHQLPLEVMDTGAACRTYNVLVSEDRRVAALMFPVA